MRWARLYPHKVYSLKFCCIHTFVIVGRPLGSPLVDMLQAYAGFAWVYDCGASVPHPFDGFTLRLQPRHSMMFFAPALQRGVLAKHQIT